MMIHRASTKDDAFIHLLDAPAGSAFVLNPQTQAFVASKDRE